MTLLSSGALALQDAGTNTSQNVQPERHSTTFTSGLDAYLQVQQLREIGDGQFTPGTVWQGDAYGFNSNMFNSTSYIHQVPALYASAGIGNRRYQSTSNFGSLGDTTYSDDNSTTRTISGVFWGLPDASPNNVKIFILGFNGTSVPNSDATFSKIEIINGGTTVTINRTDLSYDSSENGKTFFYFVGSSGTMNTNITNLGTPSSGTSLTLKVYGAATSTTVNNGIAEEYGGADSSNVALSDYYRTPGGTLHDTPNIPSSGQIKFSDFLGTTKVDIATALASGTITSGYFQSQYFTQSGYVPGSSLGSKNFSNFTYQSTSTELTFVNNINAATIGLQFGTANSSNKAYSNSGWTTIKFWKNQSNNSGTPDKTLNRASASNFTSSSSDRFAYWAWNESNLHGDFFGTSATTYFIEIE